MKLIYRLTIAFILFLSAYSILTVFIPIEPSLKIVLPLAIFVICYLVYLTYPVFEEKWYERKQRWRAPREQSRQGMRESPIAAGSANLQERGAPSPSTPLNGEVDDTLSFPAPEGKLQTLPSPRAPTNPLASTATSPNVAANTEPVALKLAAAKPTQDQTESEPPPFSECIRTVLTELERVSSYADLLPYVEMLYEQMPEEFHPKFPKYPRTLAEHLYITRAFNKAGTTEEKFSERTEDIVETETVKRLYPEVVSVAQLQDCKREWRWLVDYLSEIDAAKHRQRKKKRN